jgi:hypothetical protein
MGAHSASLFHSAVTVAEIKIGIAKLQREGQLAKARIWRRGSKPFCIFMAIASSASIRPQRGSPAPRQTARVGKVMRNVRHFAPLGVPLLDPA